MNKSEGNNTIEKIKSVILVVLFLLTILLLYFFWRDMSIDEFSFDDIKFYEKHNLTESVKAQDLIVPSHIEICLDDETYTKLERNVLKYWNDTGADGGISIKNAVSKVVLSGDSFAEEITEDKYNEVMSFVSVKAVFDYYVPYKDYCTLLGATNPIGTEMISTVSEIGFSKGNTESMFVYDGERDKYFRIVSDYASDELLDSIYLAATEENTTYYPLESFVGKELKNDVLVPAFLESDLVTVSAYPDMGLKTQGEVTEIAKSFFSGTFDFVRRIEEENGRTTYMYGYGEKILTIDENCTVEYRADTEGSSQLRYFDALQLVLASIQVQGGFVTAEGQALTPYLYDAKLIDGGYRFEFGIILNGEKIFYLNGNAAIAEIANGQLSYFKRQYISFDEEAEKGQLNEAHSAINVIAQNYNFIYESVLKDAEVSSDNNNSIDEAGTSGMLRDDERFDYVVSQISDISSGYAYIPEKQALVPCYAILMFDGSKIICFDLYTAEPLTNEQAVGITGE